MLVDIISFAKYKSKQIITNTSCHVSKRHIEYIILCDIYIIGRNCVYPNCLLYDYKHFELVSPYDERIMSLNKESFYAAQYDIADIQFSDKIYFDTPVYFFIYNFDNYYHFIYDTLSYLCCYFKLKQKIPVLKLLVSYPNVTKKEFYRFNLDIFELLHVSNDIIIHNNDYIYKQIYIGNSLTHSGYSNSVPHNDIYRLFDNLSVPTITKNFPKKIYISRRTWEHNDKSNLGTDYTQRRKMENEDKLVEQLKKYEFEEIFCEKLSMPEKINLFRNAEFVIGPIGGGMCNLIFSHTKTKVICIVSPYFLDINCRFKHCMEHTDIMYVYDTKCTSGLFRRVKIIDTISEHLDKIGEVMNIIDDNYIINLSNNDIAGFNNLVRFPTLSFKLHQLQFLDKGLNSPYLVDIEKVICQLQNTIK